jgi:hypothetical protein
VTLPDGPEQTPDELAGAMRRREHVERERAAEEDRDREARAHERRADKAAYLHEKLEEQVRSDRRRDHDG